jgi:hypothetical protein
MVSDNVSPDLTTPEIMLIATSPSGVIVHRPTLELELDVKLMTCPIAEASPHGSGKSTLDIWPMTVLSP